MRAVWTMMTKACQSADIAGGAPPMIAPAPEESPPGRWTPAGGTEQIADYGLSWLVV